jgi:hypothetical protein
MLLRTEENGWCCSKGKYLLPALPSYPRAIEEEFEIYNQQLNSLSRKLNNLFAFTILGVTGGFRKLPAPSNVAITGRVYHQILDLTQGNHSLRWFLHDESGRNSQAMQQQVPVGLVSAIRQMLIQVNPFIQHLRASFQPNHLQHMALELYTPSTSSGGEIAAIIHGNNLHQVHPRSVLIQQNGNPTPQKIDILSPLYEPLQFPIFFPHGTPGWSVDKPMSQIRWYRCRLLSEHRFQQFGRLCGEYLVDMYSRVEDQRLAYIR